MHTVTIVWIAKTKVYLLHVVPIACGTYYMQVMPFFNFIWHVYPLKTLNVLAV